MPSVNRWEEHHPGQMDWSCERMGMKQKFLHPPTENAPGLPARGTLHSALIPIIPESSAYFLLFCCRNIPNPSSLLLSSCLLLQMLQASRWKEALPMHLHSFFQSSEVLLTELPLPELQVPELLVSLLSEHQDRRS